MEIKFWGGIIHKMIQAYFYLSVLMYVLMEVLLIFFSICAWQSVTKHHTDKPSQLERWLQELAKLIVILQGMIFMVTTKQESVLLL